MSPSQLEVTWDAAKAQANFAKHGITFAQAAMVLLDPLAVSVFDAAHSQTEDRWFTLGMSTSGRIVAVAHTFQPMKGTTRVRIISARPATRRERQQYEH